MEVHLTPGQKAFIRQAAETSLARGEGRVLTKEPAQELADKIKQRDASDWPPSHKHTDGAPGHPGNRIKN
jgi:hypothetical protein